MKTVLVTTSPVFGSVGKLPQFIADHGWELVRCADPALPDGGIGAHLDRMDFLVVGLLPATAEIMDKAPKLRAILKHGVGVDNIDIPAATARKIPVLSAPGANANAVAELAVGGMFSLARRIPQAHNRLLGGIWERSIGTELSGKTLGIVGFGNIGKTLALKATSLGMRVIASDIRQDLVFAEANGIEFVELPELLERSDFVSLHIFGGKENANLINAETLALMRPTAYLMNYARGEVVDLTALDAALNKGALKGAAIDAYTTEPPDLSHPVFANPKVIFTPHTGADTSESVERVGMMNVLDIESILKGERPSRVLNPTVYD
ncbi:D-isomer specific 2-hydroxyacid dehydrogenase, NAD binding subunit [uncultured delta proteobacterium]|uniref:D-isomer specific 2-hydroxyacid dehydrogenase, NAD binding subunit n=1 Tax=uncultured delta proteobacterium TaxID=34034 RepID=A0A212KBW2_9DELT|nr:D-isomer specific 2-hydroxyacid dehydrogenase, NAD binding subunit [uncultured delta proteobacterium]